MKEDSAPGVASVGTSGELIRPPLERFPSKRGPGALKLSIEASHPFSKESKINLMISSSKSFSSNESRDLARI